MRLIRILVVSALVILPVGVTGAESRIVASPPEPQLRLHRATFDARTPEPAAPASTRPMRAMGTALVRGFYVRSGSGPAQ